MQNILKNKSLNYLDCDKGGLHDGECLNYICLDQKCQNQKIFCSVCLQEDHQQHVKNIMPLKKFLALISDKIDKNINQSIDPEEYLEKIENALQGNLYQLKNQVENISQQIKQLETSINTSYQTVKQRIMSQAMMSENMPKVLSEIINGEYSSVKDLQQSCVNLVESIKFNGEKIEIDFNPQAVFEQYSKMSKLFIDEIEKQKKSFQSNFENLNNILEKSKIKTGTFNLNGFNFSNTKKATKIGISDNNMTATQNGDGEYRYVTSEQFLSKSDITYQAFKIKCMSGWVGVGVAVEDILKTKSYAFNSYTTTGHGAWLVSSNSYTWSTQDQKENQQSTSFPFGTGDVVLMKVDPTQQQISFMKKGDNVKKIKHLKFKPLDNQEYTVCANLCQKNDAVTLIDFDIKDQF